MSGFLATRFSRVFFGLLIVSCVLGMTLYQGKKNLLVDNQGETMTAKSREELSLEEKWNVEALYPSYSAWQGEFEEVSSKEESKNRFGEIIHFRGKLSDPKQLSELLAVYFDLDRKLSKLYTYAHLRHDEDLGDDACKSGYGLITSTYYNFQEETAWIVPELLGMDGETFTKLLEDKNLSSYRFFLEKIARQKPHTRSFEVEEVLASSQKALEASHKAFSALNNADLTFEEAIDSEGNHHALTKGSYAVLMRSKDPALRRSAFGNLHKAYEEHANTFCEMIQGETEAHAFMAKTRNFSSCLDAALFPHQVDVAVYKNLIQAVRGHLPALHEYVRLRKEVLGLEEIYYSDLMVPLVEETVHMDYSTACQEVIDSVAPLGKKYQENLQLGLLNERWVDVYETPRKRSGAYSSGCYDSMPYILLNYQGMLGDVLTLAHEAGHSMHSLLSRQHQSYPYAQYPIFVAEVASTFNEQLLLRHLKSKTKEKRELASLINHEMDGIRATIFRQTLFAEFELQLHEWVEEGIPLTPKLISEYYAKLTQEYYGPELKLDEQVAIEWARVPHFYYNFYVYQYATGLSAALDLFQKVMQDDTAKERYLTFLSSGGSRYPIDLLHTAGVDMRSTHSVDAALTHFRELIQEFQQCQ